MDYIIFILLFVFAFVYWRIKCWQKRKRKQKEESDKKLRQGEENFPLSSGEIHPLPQALTSYAQEIEELNKELQAKITMLSAKSKELDEVAAKLEKVKSEINEREIARLSVESELVAKKNEIVRLESVTNGLREAQRAWQLEVELRAKGEDEVAFYSVQLSKSDIGEVGELLSLAGRYPKVNLAIRKAVYAVYVREKAKELIGRVGASGKCGIYKITEISTGRCYVGQAVDIGDRWTTHIKRAIGAEEATSNRLYPVMQEKGIASFTFMILESVERERLREREVYWQEFYSAVSFGFSIK